MLQQQASGPAACRVLEPDSVDGDGVVEVTGAPRCGMGDLVSKGAVLKPGRPGYELPLRPSRTEAGGVLIGDVSYEPRTRKCTGE